ncbi:hypothetical protein EBB07_31025 [Paenibacillaceae bacterium]|nr:hypothetical protein EBB07_31025 [Paenibacillaceae bacterium]
MVSMTGTFLDTIIDCSVTGFVMSGIYVGHGAGLELELVWGIADIFTIHVSVYTLNSTCEYAPSVMTESK